MWREKIVLFAFVVIGVLPLSLSGSADFDNNFIVDWKDLAMFVDYWLYDYNDNERCWSWDLAENGVIDFNDLAVIAGQWLADYDFGDFADFAAYWRRKVDYRFLDRRFDLYGGGLLASSGDGFVNFSDFSVFASEWMTTTNPCDDTTVLGPWSYVNFTGIGPCGAYDCWFEENESDYVYDDCGNYLYVACKETPEFGSYCAYNYYFNWNRVGLCIYTCGRNAFRIRKNASGTRILQTRHLTRDIPPQDPECSSPNPPCPGCDEGTTGKYDWQITHYNDVNGVRTVYCRQSYLEPVTNDLWEPYQGEPSACELSW